MTTRYNVANKVFLVCDNLNTRTGGAFYEVFPPQKARELIHRIEFRYTSKHVTRLNMAENALSLVSLQCVNGRWFGTIKLLRSETRDWSIASNRKQWGVDLRFKVKNARSRLKSRQSTSKF